MNQTGRMFGNESASTTMTEVEASPMPHYLQRFEIADDNSSCHESIFHPSPEYMMKHRTHYKEKLKELGVLPMNLKDKDF